MRGGSPLKPGGYVSKHLAKIGPVQRVYPFAETHLHVMKNLRRYDVASLAQHVLAELQKAATPSLQGIGTLPWIPGHRSAVLESD